VSPNTKLEKYWQATEGTSTHEAREIINEMRAKQVFKPLDLLRVFLFCRMLCPLIIMLICSAGYGNHAATMGKRGPAAAKTQAD
jgi:hypothetical protein